jgi:hypothetical protein
MAALPIAMLSATVLGALGVGIAFSNSSSDTEDYILLLSGQRIRIETRVRLNEEGIKANPDSCLVGQEGRVTKLNRDTRTVTVQCKKGNTVEQHPADMLLVTDSGINAPGIDIAGGWAVEGSTVRLLASAKRLYPGRGLASPFYKAVGTIVAINKTRKEVHVTSESLNSKTDTATWYYNAVDLELVGRPIVNRKRGIHNGEIQEGSTVRLKVGADGKILPDVLAKYTKKFGLTSTAGVDQPEKTLFTQPSTKLADEKSWEKTGKVTAVIEDPKDPSKTWVRVLCVSKKSRGTVAEEQYDAADLEAVPATSIPRAGIPIFGGMAEEGVHVKVRVERRDAVASKPLGRPAFGEVGTVTRVDGEADDNLKVFVTCNGQNADEQTGDWYEPEDLEVVDPDETEGEPVFGGRVIVGSMVRVMQSGRGKKCLGTMEVGDIGSVKGIDPNAADNLKINVTCGRSSSAKQSEWYDPRDLQVFFGVEDAGTPLAQARSALDIAERNLARQRRQPEYDAAEEARLLQDVANAKQRVDDLSKETIDMTKVKEVYENAQEKLQSAQKLKRDIESLRLTASKQTTCGADPGRAARFTQQALDIEDNYYATLDIIDPDTFDWNYRGPAPVPGNALKPVQYSDRFKSAWKDLYRTWQRRPAPDPANDPTRIYRLKLQLEERLRNNLANGNRNSPEDFDNLTNLLARLSNTRITYDAIPVTPLKSALKDIDEKLQKLKEVARDIETAAYSGNTPTERLLARITDLIAENNAKQDIIEGPAPARGAGELGPLTTAYNTAFANEQQAKFRFEVAKQNFQKNTTYSAIHSTQVSDFQVNEAQRVLDNLNALPRPAPGPALTDLNKRIAKAQDDLRKKTTERDIKRAYDPVPPPAVPPAVLPINTPQEIVDRLTSATREYIDAQKATLKARKAEQIKSGELTCLLQSTEAATELQVKIRKIVDGKCKILADADAVNAQIDNLIDVRKRAFLMAQASRDPSFGRGLGNGQFAVPVGTDFAGRIQLMNEALAGITADPTLAGLQQLIEISGTYGGDTLLDEARGVAARTYRGGADSRAPGMQKYKARKGNLISKFAEESRAERAKQDVYRSTRGINPFTQSQSQKFRDLATTTEDEDTDTFEDETIVPTTNPFTAERKQNQRLLPTAVPKSYSRRFRELANPAEVAPPDNTFEDETIVPRTNPFMNEESEPETSPSPISQSQRFRELANPKVTPPENPFKPTQSQSQRFRELANPKVTPPENPFKPTQSQRFRDLIDRDDKKAKEEGAKWLAREQEGRRIQREKQAEIEERQNRADEKVALREKEQLKAQMAKVAKEIAIKRDNHNLTRDILDVSKRLANDQILRLKMLVVSNSTSVDLAHQLTIQGDRLEQEIRDSRTEFQFNIAQRGGANGDDFKIQNDVDYYKEELEKSKMCIMDFKKKAIDQYNLDLAKLEQQKEDIKAKVFEIKEPQENNKGNKGKDLSTWSVDDLNKKIKEVDNQISGLKKDKKDTTSADKYLQRLKDALNSKKTGGTRRVTIRQPPRPKHRVY